MKPLYLIPFFMTVALIVWWHRLPALPSSFYSIRESFDRLFILLAAIGGICLTTLVIALLDWWLD